MKKLLLLAAMVAAPVFAREPIENFTIKKTLDCGDVYQLAENLKRDFGEEAVMRFDKRDSKGEVKIILFLNMKTGTSTIVEALHNGASCIITEGENMGIIAEIKDRL